MKSGDLLIQKYNPHHDAKGRFTTSGSATFVSTKIKRAGGGETFHDVGAKFREAYKAKTSEWEPNEKGGLVLHPPKSRPATGELLLHRGKPVVYSGDGGAFDNHVITEQDVKEHGEQLRPFIGQKGRFAWYDTIDPKYHAEAISNNARRESALKTLLNTPLSGSEKQKKWAEDIRQNALQGTKVHQLEILTHAPEEFKTAKFWIDNKNYSGRELANKLIRNAQNNKFSPEKANSILAIHEAFRMKTEQDIAETEKRQDAFRNLKT